MSKDKIESLIEKMKAEYEAQFFQYMLDKLGEPTLQELVADGIAPTVAHNILRNVEQIKYSLTFHQETIKIINAELNKET